MRLPITILRCGLLLGLLTGSMGACQRASYQFQPVASPIPQAVVPELGAESAVVTLAAAPLSAAPVASSPRVKCRRPVRPRLARVLPLLPVTRPVATAGVAAAASRRQEPKPVAQPVRYRSRGIAIILALLSITYLPLSLHNFYLGYHGRAAAAIALLVIGLYFLFIGFAASLFGGGVAALGVVGAVMLGGWLIWQITDFVRIITKDLKPKDGEYTPRFFQTRPAVKEDLPPRTD